MITEREQELNKELTPIERKFVMELLKDGNRAAAAERAGCQGTKNTFRRLGHQMINKPHVKKAYDMLMGKSLEKAMINRENLISEIQDTIMEARVAKKFEAAFKGYQQLIDIVIGSTKKIKDMDTSPATGTDVFANGDENVDIKDDITKFFNLVQPKINPKESKDKPKETN